VGFATGYDVNMLLRDVTKSALRDLWESETVTWYRDGAYYRITWRLRKFFRVHRATRVMGPWIGGTVWDVWPFFQSPFVTACEKYGVGTPEEHAALASMKGRRDTFRAKDLPEIEPYNQLELKLLVELMDTLRRSLQTAGLRISRWDGPGAVAASLLTREGVKDAPPLEPPEDVLDAAQYAYYGGRVECAQYGHHAAPVYHYDINSAYPAALQHVPCRRAGCGSWERIPPGAWSLALASRFAVHHVRWAFPRGHAFYPFPWRSARGGVYFPREGEGWVWTAELQAAADFEKFDAVEYLEGWSWNGHCRHAGGYAWVPTIYAERERARALRDGAEHALKLSLNSLYGKCAQRAGAIFTREGWRLPPFHDLSAAGWVTSHVRAQLYRAAMQSPADVIMLATDAIYSTVPLELDVDRPGEKTLGKWTGGIHPSATIVQSGVYWLAHEDGTRTLFSRGFERSSIDHDATCSAWHTGVASLTCRQRRFVGLGLALAGKEGTIAHKAAFQRWRTWTDEPRELTLHPWQTKRLPIVEANGRPADASKGLVRTTATETRRFWEDMVGERGRMTTPSPVPWRPLPGAPVDTEGDVVARAEDESDDAAM
jgi:hypothetical protein